MKDQGGRSAWAPYIEMIPDELRIAGWTLWSCLGDGATRGEAVRGAIREALAIETGDQS